MILTADIGAEYGNIRPLDKAPAMLSPRGQPGLEAKFYGLGLGLTGSGLGLGLMKHWPWPHVSWPQQ